MSVRYSLVKGGDLKAAVRLVVVLGALLIAACSGPAPAAPGPQDPAGHARPRPEIPTDWPAGKRIVMHATPSLKQSYVVACDLPIPAWNYQNRGHRVTIALDADAVTAFRRDSAGKTPLDRLDILKVDLEDLADFLEVPLRATPRTYGELFRHLAGHGIRIIANEDALKARGIKPAEMDPMVTVVSGNEFKRLMSDVDALVPFDDLAVPHHPLFHSGGH